MSTNTENFKTEQKAKWADGKRANGANFAQLFDAIARLIEDEVTSVPAADIPAAVKDFLDNSDKYNNTDAVAKLKEFAKKPETLKETLNAVRALEPSSATKTAIANVLEALNPGSGLTVADFERAASDKEVGIGSAPNYSEINERARKIRRAVAGIAGKSDNSKHYVFQAGMGEVTIWKYSNNSEAEIVTSQTSGVMMDVYVQNEKGFAVPFIDGTVTNASILPVGLTDVWLLTTLDGARYVYNKTAQTLKPAASLIG